MKKGANKGGGVGNQLDNDGKCTYKNSITQFKYPNHL